VAAPDGRQAPPVVARQPLAEVRRVAVLPFAAVVPRAVLTAAAQVSEAPPSAASAVLHAARNAAARRRVAVLHVIAAKRTWEQPVAASRVAARQPSEPFGMATSTFGLGAQLAALVTVALQRRIVARPDRWSAAGEHWKPVPSPERLRHVLASTHQALVACPCCPALAVR
jgi:hypothetical protein